jgi:hypothetical protein
MSTLGTLFVISFFGSLGYALPVQRTIIDQSTPDEHRSLIRRHDNLKLNLVMSDEYEEEGRRFDGNRDNIFSSLHRPDDSNQALQFYNSNTSYVTTKRGQLRIIAKAVKQEWTEWDKSTLRMEHRVKNYTSGMVQSWNKFCFTGGVLEMKITLPGGFDTGSGVWPAAWLMGNLARATFAETTLYMWPWSYDRCGRIKHLGEKQKISACSANPGFGFNPHQGRGAPEIDIFEVMPGHNMPSRGHVPASMFSSLQVCHSLCLVLSCLVIYYIERPLVLVIDSKTRCSLSIISHLTRGSDSTILNLLPCNRTMIQQS